MLTVRTENNFSSLCAVKYIPRGTVLTQITGEITPEASRYSIQVGGNEHAEVPYPLKYTNHACVTPNCKFDFDQKPWTFVSERDINEGDMITFDYVTTEYKMKELFECLCGGVACRKNIKGFHFLTEEEKGFLLSQKKVSPVIRTLYEQGGK